MNDRDQRRLERAQSVLTFFQNNEADFPPSSVIAPHMATIEKSVDRILRAAAGQAPRRATKASVLDALLLDFKRIAATARAIELRSGETGFAAPFNQVPRRIEQDIREYADGLLQRLEDNNAPLDQGGDTPAQKAAKAALRQRFLELHIRADFVADLREDRDQLDEIQSRNMREVQEGIEDTALISEELAKISEQVDILDPIIGNVYELHPEKLHAWQRASRVSRSARRNKKGEGAAPTDDNHHETQAT